MRVACAPMPRFAFPQGFWYYAVEHRGQPVSSLPRYVACAVDAAEAPFTPSRVSAVRERWGSVIRMASLMFEGLRSSSTWLR